MNYWDKIIQEVVNKDDGKQNFVFTNLRKVNSIANVQSTPASSKTRKLRTYNLGKNCEGVSFTQREAECMLQILQGRTISQTGHALALSPRTVEFYIKNMKIKLKCRTKSELIGKVLNSDFMSYKFTE